MITNKLINRSARIDIMFVISLSVALIIAIASCAESKKVVKTRKEVSPPPTSSAIKVEVGSEQEGIKTRQRNTPVYSLSGTDTIFWTTTERPTFPGGSDALRNFKSKNLKYPKTAKSNML